MSKQTKIIFGLMLFVALTFAAVYFYAFSDSINTYDYAELPDGFIPQYKEVQLNFHHRFDGSKSLPLMAACLIDTNKDGVDEVFLGGGAGQQDALYRFENGKFVDITETHHLPTKAVETSHGAISWDLDGDGWADLLVARESGLYLYRNLGGRFEQQQLDIDFDEKSVPVSMTLGDVDNDGDADLFVCAYLPKSEIKGQTIFNEEDYGAKSILLLNDGQLNFRDVTKSAGLDYTHNTFQAVFVDIDDDGWLDLVIAYDTGEVRTYKNNGGARFQLQPNPLTGKFAYPMGIAVGDYNNDGLPDFFFSNIGTTIPHFLARGDLREDQELITDWLLFRNLGGFQFDNVSNATKTANFEFGWGCVFSDFNLDGKQDLLVAENYVDYPLHQFVRLPGRMLLQLEDQTFVSVEHKAGVRNPYFGISPLVTDFNNDGYPDIVFANLNGPARALINKGGPRHYLKVQLPNEARSIGAKVTVESANRKRSTSFLVIGEGLSSDQSKTLIFGLGEEKSVQNVYVTFAGGEKDTVGYPPVNTTVILPPKPVAIQDSILTTSMY